MKNSHGGPGRNQGRKKSKVKKKNSGLRFYPKHLKLIKAQAKLEGISQPKLILKAFLQYWKRENKK